MLAGGVFSWLVLMPAIYFFGSHLSGPLYPGTVPITADVPLRPLETYVRPMGAGAVAAAGLITLLRTAAHHRRRPHRRASRRSGTSKARRRPMPIRTEHDLPPVVVFGGSAPARPADVPLPPVQARPRSPGRPARQHRRRPARRRLRLPLRHRLARASSASSASPPRPSPA